MLISTLSEDGPYFQDKAIKSLILTLCCERLFIRHFTDGLLLKYELGIKESTISRDSF
jgi:hypothetical protein